MRAFVLNFDADAELAGAPAVRSMPRAVACRLLRARVRLVPRGDVVIGERPLDPAAIEAVHCWMPTPRARGVIQRAGLPMPHAPPFDVLYTVNARRFSCALGAGPPGTRWVSSLAELPESFDGDRWLRRAHGFAGRGRHIAPRGPRQAATLAFARAAINADGGFELAPRVEILAEYALHGFLGADGALTLGEPLRSHVDPHGQWLRASHDASLTAQERGELTATTTRVARALHDAGYFGPFGVDALRWRLDGARGFTACNEINARYTLSWALGMRGRRVDLQP